MLNPLNPTTMKAMMILGMALLSSSYLVAGNDPVPSEAGGSRHHCIMADAATWTKLGVSAEQQAKVRDVQEACKRDLEMAKTAGNPTEASVDRHVEVLKSVLTPEQFMAWEKWCSEKQAHHGEPSKL